MSTIDTNGDGGAAVPSTKAAADVARQELLRTALEHVRNSIRLIEEHSRSGDSSNARLALQSASRSLLEVGTLLDGGSSSARSQYPVIRDDRILNDADERIANIQRFVFERPRFWW